MPPELLMLDMNIALQQQLRQQQIQLSTTSSISFQCIFFILPEITFSFLFTEALNYQNYQLLCVESLIVYINSMALQLDASNLCCIAVFCIELSG